MAQTVRSCAATSTVRPVTNGCEQAIGTPDVADSLRSMKTRSLVIATVAGMLSLAACGGSDSSAPTTPINADVVVNALDGLKWDQPSYSAKAGDVVIAATNKSGLPHNVHLITPDGTLMDTSITIGSKGVTKSATFKVTAGTYTLICTVPGHSNMKAPLVVS